MARRKSAGAQPAERKGSSTHGNAFPWSSEIEDEILHRLMRGESIATICGPGRDDFLPGEVTFYKHLTEDEGFAKKYTRAREVQAHREFDEIRQIAQDATPEDVAVARLQIDARKWRAGKLAPKVYGDKVTHANDAENPLPAAQVTVFALPDNGRD